MPVIVWAEAQTYLAATTTAKTTADSLRVRSASLRRNDNKGDLVVRVWGSDVGARPRR